MNTSQFQSNSNLGILGGGQLGKMLLVEAGKLGMHVAVMDPSPSAPCASSSGRFIVGDIQDYDAVIEFGRDLDVLTVEIEHVNVDALESLQADGVAVHPDPAILRVIQNKAGQKDFYRSRGLPTVDYRRFDSLVEIDRSTLTFPIVWKAATGGYDGRGVSVLRSEKDMDGLPDVPGYLETYLGRSRELAVIVGRNVAGEAAVFPPVEMDFHPVANLVEMIHCPADIPDEIGVDAERIGIAIANKLKLVGVLAIELFYTADGELFVNESAPRPHNSGHLTIEGNMTSQYAQHLRAILGLPLGDTSIRTPSAMINLVGAKGHTGSPVYNGLAEVMAEPGVFVHLYGKAETRPFRKMGHVTVVGTDEVEIRAKAQFVRETLTITA
ncbi:MAG: 5-(carboxyamino)imidazole ribonucleotide synthase [Rhodothermales bacterium]|nr:5-(carboxyamino)imidazole ribonucleotide synthase [Rhodothermales bacterium]